MKRIILLAFYAFIFIFQIFSQNNAENDNWKNKWLYTSGWAGYGTGFSIGLCADVQLAKRFALGLEFGLLDKSYPAVSLLPKFTLRPWNMEVDLYGGLGFGYSTVYGFIWIIPHGIVLGYKLGPGLLIIDGRNGMGWSVGAGYRMGFMTRNNQYKI